MLYIWDSVEKKEILYIWDSVEKDRNVVHLGQCRKRKKCCAIRTV